ncbi:MAG: RNA polymerase sigma-70 factor [Saprospiraceae bacterium]|nr:RNA polymerase sigma-70 factor [Saprospiraceae bacterium]
MTTEDQQQAQALRQGDERAFDDLFRAWYTPLVRYAHTFTDGDLDEAEDLVQETFAKVWTQRTTLDFQHSLKAYLYRMVHNQALNRLRAQRTHERFSNHQLRHMANEFEPPQDNPELQTQFQEVLNALPAQCRQVFGLSRFEDLKYREIAEQLGISIKTVETHMGKALRILRHELAEYLTLILLLTRLTNL